MFAYELLPRLTHLTLTVDNTEEYWEDRIQFIGSDSAWLRAKQMEEKLCSE